MSETGECGRLGSELDADISATAAGRGVSESSALLARWRWRGGTSGRISEAATSLDAWLTWLLSVDCLELVVDVVGVGDLGILLGCGFSAIGRVEGGVSRGEGRFWTTFSNNLLVRIAADWIIATWWARLGKMAGMSRGVKGTMTSCAKVRNSASHLKAIDCWISSSVERVKSG